MRRLLPILLLMVFAVPAAGQDIREAARKAEADRQAALQEARDAETRILADRAALLAEVERLERRQAELEDGVADLERRQVEGARRRDELAARWSGRELAFREISGNVRVAARELESLLKASPLSAGRPWRLETVAPLLDTGYFPDIDDITAMADVFFDEIARGQQVTLAAGDFIGRDGKQTRGDVLQLGKFTTVYRTGDEIGFLNWQPDGGQLFALAALPPRGVRSSLEAYLEGRSAEVPVDMSGGAALRQLTHRTGFVEQLQAGGPIIWPIGLIALAALVIVIAKIVFLNRVHGNTDRIMGRVTDLAAQGDWDGCERIMAENAGKNWPVIHVIRAGLGARGEDRSTLETVLQESILHELPRIQQGIAILAVLGAVAPLLGLLGTVTGMIDTFRVITLFGTSDPKLMSGGISEALVTTELGLAVAIPIMLLHTFINRKADHLIGDMEEKAVQLTNIIQKRRAQEEATA
ncbi:MotA/TolQ/ExbB proton channel family protein [bacterium]|nr:MotA/TolQ/ExbB proton channel family protein [bacterium]